MASKSSNQELIFFAALDKPTGHERSVYLDQACGEDVELRQRVEKLLAAEPFVGAFLEDSLIDRAAASDPARTPEGPGSRIGPYKLLQEIGEGGFGVVYMAEQLEPVRRQVALKIIKPGMDTREVIARFEAERQALAMMDHANIARVFDAGATHSGLPYFVMELVKGVPITEFCDTNNLETEKRLELFMAVCRAIQHAHQKGIIHRDLKPSNVLVTLHDGDPVPKVIDFGISKAIHHRLTEKTLFTRYGQMVGTPQYMSPEQAEMSGLNVDTRSDIYSLGVLLYELLTGSTPLDVDRFRAVGYQEMLRIIQQEEPAKPSTRLSTLGNRLTVVCEHRKTDPKHLRQMIRGDLDWIVMKALDKHRDRRYDTANSLALDIQRHLNEEPVLAGPPSAAYRLQKAFRRNRLAFIAATAVVVALLAGAGVSTWQAFVATKARGIAQVAQDQAQASAREATASLYGSLLGQAHATRIARQVGYREEVFDLLRKARDLDTQAKQLAALRLEAVASMGDFVGFRPRQIASAPATNRFDGMQLSADGRLLALRDTSGGIQLHELPSGREVGGWRLEQPVREFTFNDAGDRLIAIHWKGGSKDTDGAHVTEFAMSPAGKWQQATSRPMPGAFNCVSIKTSTFVLVAGSWPMQQFQLVEVGSWRTAHSLQRAEGSWGSMVAATRDGHMLALIGNADAGHAEPQIEIWDLPREQLLHRLPPDSITSVTIAFSDDGHYLLSQAMQGTRIYETTTFSVVDEFSGHTERNSLGSFLPGTPLVSVPRPQQRRILIRDHQKHETLAVFEEAGMPTAAAFAPGGEFLVTLSSMGVNLYHLEAADECMTLAGHQVSVPGVAFSPDGARLASVAKDRTVAMWNADSGKRIWEGDQPLPGPGQAVAFSSDGGLLATGDWETQLIQLWDAETGRQLMQLDDAPGRQTWSLVFVPDPQHGLLLVRMSADDLSVWQIGPTRPVLDRENDAVRWIGSRSLSLGDGLVAAPDGKRIAFGSPRTSSEPWEYSTTIQDPLGEASPLTLLPCTSSASVQPMLFTPDGQSVAVLTTENRVAVFDAATGELRRAFSVAGSTTQGRNLVLNHTGRWLAVTSPSMRGVDIYDFATGELRYELPAREGTVYWLAWHPKEPRLAVARDNGDIAIWDLAKIDRQLTELGLGFAPEPAEAEPTNVPSI